jgi:hypothetical protein
MSLYLGSVEEGEVVSEMLKEVKMYLGSVEENKEFQK